MELEIHSKMGKYIYGEICKIEEEAITGRLIQKIVINYSCIRRVVIKCKLIYCTNSKLFNTVSTHF